MTKTETITPNELMKVLEVSNALDLGLLCTITDTIVKIGVHDTWKIKIYECSENDKYEIFNMLNEHYRARNNKLLNK